MPRSASARRVSPRRFLAVSASALAALASLATLSPRAAAQQVLWKDNPITGKVVGLTYGSSGWNAAEAQAVAYGGHLVTIRSAAENQWLIDNFSTVWLGSTGFGPWMGLNDAQTEGVWQWVSGEQVSPFFTYWGSGEPNDFLGVEDWAHYGTSINGWRWNDLPEPYQTRSLIEVLQRPLRSWSWPTSYGTGVRPVYGCGLDFDADGNLDYASPDNNSAQVSLWRNDGAGVFAFAASIGGCGGVYTTAASDWDRDGDVDLLAANDTPGQLLLLRNDGGAWARVVLANVPLCHGISIADLNSDGLDDVVTTSLNPDNLVRVFLRDSSGTLAVPLAYESHLVHAFEPSIVDLDGDEISDLIVAGGGVRIFRGTGIGTFTDCGELGTGSSFRCAAADLDGDGLKEILAIRRDNDRVQVWKRTIQGSFSSSGYALIQDLISGDAPHWIDTSDMDGDGDLDVVVPSSLSGTVQVWRNDLGSLVADHVLTAGSDPLCVTVGDVNDDTKPDIIVSNHVSNSFSVLLNQSIFDCNGNGIDDPLDVNSGFAQDCNGNGRPDSCDLALYGSTLDFDNDGILDECEAAVAALAPSSGAAFAPRVVTVTTRFVPDGPATLTLDSAALAAPVVLPMVVAGNSATVTLPALGAASVADVVASAAVSYTDAQGNLQVSLATPALYAWDVPQIVSSVPNNAPFDQSTGVTFVLRDHVATGGVGSATFGSSVPQAAYLFTVGGQTIVTTVAPAQAGPGPVSVLLRFGNEQTLAQRGFVYLGPGITSLSATEGWQAGGDALDVGLFGFAPGVPVEVRIGSGQQVASVVATPSGVPAASSISLVTPFVPASGALDLEVVQYAGQPNEKRASSPGAWLSKPPAITSVSPGSGFQGGGEVVTLGLEGFPAGRATQVELGSLGFTVTNSGTIASSTVAVTTTLAPQAGTFDVRARQSAGTPTQLEATVPGGFTFIGPSLLGVQPSSGPLEGGTQVVAKTSGFDASQPAQVQLGGTTLVGTVTGSGASQTVSFRTKLATASGLTDVTISQGVLVATLPSGFTFDAARVTTYCQAKVTSAGTTPVIGFTGSPSLSTGDFAITLSNALPNKYGLYFHGAVATAPFQQFYGGKLCVQPPTVRGPVIETDASGFASSPFVVTPAMVGTDRAIQWWFRDPADANTVGLSRGLKVVGFYP